MARISTSTDPKHASGAEPSPKGKEKPKGGKPERGDPYPSLPRGGFFEDKPSSEAS